MSTIRTNNHSDCSIRWSDWARRADTDGEKVDTFRFRGKHWGYLGCRSKLDGTHQPSPVVGSVEIRISRSEIWDVLVLVFMAMNASIMPPRLLPKGAFECHIQLIHIVDSQFRHNAISWMREKQTSAAFARFFFNEVRNINERTIRRQMAMLSRMHPPRPVAHDQFLISN